jgi:UDP-3-O-[3-hydroxymyristoyl] glucosamine N-acyltransferase
MTETMIAQDAQARQVVENLVPAATDQANHDLAGLAQSPAPSVTSRVRAVLATENSKIVHLAVISETASRAVTLATAHPARTSEIAHHAATSEIVRLGRSSVIVHRVVTLATAHLARSSVIVHHVVILATVLPPAAMAPARSRSAARQRQMEIASPR